MNTEIQIVVKQQDIDELNHVNNKVYVDYLEEARGDWYAQTGFSFDIMRERNLGTVVLKLNITFLQEATLGEELTVKTIPVRLGRTSFDLQQKIYNERGEKITEANVVSVMFDRQNRKSVPVVEEIARHFPS